ncbi:hypothetical protein ACCQ13_13610 [Xanthomonas sp. NCPPB 1638]|uniref:hypothetical protein n=1 Tax=Xanthomonas TaxID=338 RepID=UPI00132F3AB2|nr:hypothetical protein [Xanthomonas cucurbitae]QHG87767.1 hypothetical protein EBN15_13295 [Xanthomonas cucurbitae]WDM74384.1 hypothetical protein K6982_13285 [Xanthomonas cucurbitae]
MSYFIEVLVGAKIVVEILILLLFAAFALLMATRALVIYISRKSVSTEKSVIQVSEVDFFPPNTPGEAVRSVKAFCCVFLEKPRSVIGILAGIYLLLWLAIVLIIISLTALTSSI